MAEVTGFTKARMDDLDNDIINGASIVGEDLVLTKKGGASVNAGNVKGPTGPPGEAGTVTQTDITQAILDRQPGPWVNLTLATSWQDGFAGFSRPPSYRVENDEIRLGGVIEWTGATQPAGTLIAFASALPIALTPAYDMIIGLTDLTFRPAEIRMYANDRILRMRIRAHTLDTNTVISIDHIKLPLG